jgi:FkbM family methyltransferase
MKANLLLASFNRLPVWRRRLDVWGFTLTPPTLDRWLYLWMHRLGCMGQAERVLLTRLVQPGMQVADIGANLGLYSLLLTRLVGPQGRVYAFEPDSLMASALRANLAANGAAHAEVFAGAVGAAPGSAILQRHAVNSGDNRIALSPGTPLHFGPASVPVWALQDALRGRRLDFIKMDIQGWEGEALRGIGGLLDANPGLRICLEFWPHGLRLAGTEIAQLAATLRQLRLQVTVADQGEDAAPVDLVTLAGQMRPKAYTNLLAVRR